MNLRLLDVSGPDNPKYTIGMVVIRPHKLPATFGILSKEVNQLIEWLTDRNK